MFHNLLNKKPPFSGIFKRDIYEDEFREIEKNSQGRRGRGRCFGEVVNKTLGCIFDSILSDCGLITGWWNDGYRILIEMPEKHKFMTWSACPHCFSV
jgi:hypothetical protein